MEQLYDLLHRVSRATKRRGVLHADLTFLTGGCWGRETSATGLIARRCSRASTARMALTVDFSARGVGFKSDEATYYMMAYSLAEDADLTYTARIWNGCGASSSSGRPAFFPEEGTHAEGGSGSRIRPVSTTASRSSIRSLPRRSSKVFGTNGFLVCTRCSWHSSSMCGYMFWHARAAPPSLR
jgi:hypothetical protein